MNTVQKTLLGFGLSENEASVYQQILKDGETSPYRLARETGIARTTVYEVVMSLSLKGLIELEKSTGFMKQQTKLRAKNPSSLRTILQQRRADLTSLEVDIVDILPKLKGDYHKEEANADFAFYPGIKGAKMVTENEDDNLDIPIYVWDYQTSMDAFGKDFTNIGTSEETESRKKSKYKIKELFPLNDWSRHVTTYQYSRDPNYIKHREFRYIENPVFNLKQRIVIIGNRVKIVSIEEGETWGMVINSPSFAKSLLSIFLLTWEQGTPVTDEVVKSWGKNDFFEAEQQKKKRTR